MWTLITCIKDDHDLRLVVLAALVCVLAATTALRFHRSARTESGSSRVLLMAGVGLVAGGGVWATHFIAMLAYSVDLPMSFNAELTLISFVLAVAGMGAGFALGTVAPGVWSRAAGGGVVGLSITAMHFVGVAAIESVFGIEWRWGFVAAAVIASCVGSIAAVLTVNRFEGWRDWVVPTASLVLGIVGLHFTAMAAIEMAPDLTAQAVSNDIDRMGLAFITGGVALIVILTGVLMAWIQAQGRRAAIRNLEAAFGGLPVGMALFDGAGRLTLWNAAFEQLLTHLRVVPAKGMTRPELMAQEIVHYGDAVAESVSTWAAAINNGARRGVSREWQAIDGCWLRMELFALPSGESLILVTDVTQARTYADAMTEARDKAEAANRAKSDFLANMSHEIRTPLNGILGMAQIMDNDILTPNQRDRLGVVRDCGEQLMGLLNSLLDLSKIQAGHMELELGEVDLAALMRQTTDGFSGPAALQGTTLSLSVEPSAEGCWRLDGDRVRQMVGNLLSNAVKFTASGQIEVTVSGAEGGVVIAVADTGVGIADEHLAALFERFSQVDASATRRHGGSGLGLAICKELADLMGGKIRVESALDQGSRFAIELPTIRTQAPTVEAPVDAPQVEVMDRPIRILAAEDNPINQMVLRALLQGFDCELEVVDDGAQAVAAVKAEVYDLVLMDIQMPEKTGVEASRQIRAWEAESGAPRLPIIAVTANVMTHQVEAYLEAGMDGCVAKPIKAHLLVAAIQSALENAIPSPDAAVAA